MLQLTRLECTQGAAVVLARLQLTRGAAGVLACLEYTQGPAVALARLEFTQSGAVGSLKDFVLIASFAECSTELCVRPVAHRGDDHGGAGELLQLHHAPLRSHRGDLRANW